MSNVIAVVWDFDKTLVDGYMQDPIFEKYGVDSSSFWNEVNALPDKYQKQEIRVNKDTIYLNQFIRDAHEGGRFAGLTNSDLKNFGKELKFYPGVPEIFVATKNIIDSNQTYKNYDIKLEHYIVSTGMRKIIEGSTVMEYVTDVWGCDLIEDPDTHIISELGYTIDNTSKTRALFEINKGVPTHPEIDVNAQMPESMRRVHFANMIYIADGPSDVPAFSVVKKNGGATFAVYPPNDKKAFAQVERLREDSRIDMYAEADYSAGKTAYMWIENKIKEFADRIVNSEKQKLADSVSSAPHHITE
ncbi:HAD family hydrolase [Bifidobacterium platyrrhinorum]|uniref:Haloacid dehalogenase-like hydrolase n=1 Tax=Bifidobacterium platyrrhinorum TaxID=2661628 RepID=A0A6L9SQY1_9BIFI|nr:HAD family hydrolase [Bifidobacterium platyrrhinorum]NEG54858.1 haloacid dehalogenase-like hydrolase [Bifidobacterium platyrrhinorum]